MLENEKYIELHTNTTKRWSDEDYYSYVKNNDMILFQSKAIVYSYFNPSDVEGMCSQIDVNQLFTP